MIKLHKNRRTDKNVNGTTMTDSKDHPEEEQKECYGPEFILATATDQVLEQTPACDDIYEMQQAFDRVFGSSDCIGTGQSTNEKRESMIAEWKKATRPKHRAVVRKFGPGTKGGGGTTIIISEGEIPPVENDEAQTSARSSNTRATSSSNDQDDSDNQSGIKSSDSLLKKSRAPFPEDTRGSSRLGRTPSKKLSKRGSASSSKKQLFVIAEDKGKNKKETKKQQKQDAREVDSTVGGSVNSELSSEIDYELGADIKSTINQTKTFQANFVYYPRNLSQHEYFRGMASAD